MFCKQCWAWTKGDILELKDEDWIKGMEVYLLNVIRSSRIVTPNNEKTE